MIDPDKLRALDEKATARYLLVKRGLYYRPGNQGYTGIKDHAGRYFESDAYEGVTAIHEDDAPEFSPSCFHDLREDHLRKQRDEARSALRPLAAIADWWGDDFCKRNPDHPLYGASAGRGAAHPDIRLTMAHATAARRALEEEKA